MPMKGKKIKCLWLSLCVVILAILPKDAKAQGVNTNKQTSHPEVLQEWRAGETVTAEQVKAYGESNCFRADPIPDAVWQRMQGKSYKENPHIKRADLRYVRTLHWDYDEQIYIGEMVCNKTIANDLVDIFRQLYKAKYPIERMVLPDVYDADDERQMRANNTSCFCYRTVANSKNLSKHARGLAVDLNTLYNPYCKKRADGSVFVQPVNAAKYCDRSKSFKYKIDTNDLAYKLFKAHGFIWGGSWKSRKDYQHFEK